LKIAVFGDRHTVLGFSLAGVEGKVAGEHPGEMLREFMLQEDLGVLIITGGVAEMLRSEVEYWKRQKNLPIVVEIPEFGKEVKEDRIRKLIKRAVGMEIKS